MSPVEACAADTCFDRFDMGYARGCCRAIRFKLFLDVSFVESFHLDGEAIYKLIDKKYRVSGSKVYSFFV